MSCVWHLQNVPCLQICTSPPLDNRTSPLCSSITFQNGIALILGFRPQATQLYEEALTPVGLPLILAFYFSGIWVFSAVVQLPEEWRGASPPRPPQGRVVEPILGTGDADLNHLQKRKVWNRASCIHPTQGLKPLHHQGWGESVCGRETSSP